MKNTRLIGCVPAFMIAAGVCMAADLQLEKATVMHDGRVLRLEFSGPWPKEPAGPDWLPAYEEGLAPKLSTGADLRHLGCMAASLVPPFDFMTPIQFTGKTPLPLPEPPDRFYFQLVYKDGKGHIYPCQVGDWYRRGGFGADMYADRNNMPKFSIGPFVPVPPGFTADVYLSVDGTRGTLRLYKADLPSGTISTDVDTIQWANKEQSPPGSPMRWYSFWAVDRGEDAVTWGQALTVTVPARLLRADTGAATAAAANFEVVNYSAVDKNGFTTQRWPLHEGRVVYVSSTLGDDANPGSKEKPLRTIAKAMQGGKDAKTGFRVRLLQTDVFVEALYLPKIECSLADPFVVEPYSLDGSAATARPTITKGGGGGNGSGIVIRGLRFAGSRLQPSGLCFVNPLTDVICDDCAMESIELDGKNRRVTLLRCVQTPVEAHCGLSQGTSELLLSQCVGYRGGYGQGTPGLPPGDRTIFGHNYYFQFSNPIAVAWGDFFYQGGSHGLQMRGGGIISDSVFWRNGMQAFIHSLGGTFSRNVMDLAEDISPREPRGTNIELPSTSANLVSHAAFNIVVNSLGHMPNALSFSQMASGYMAPGSDKPQNCAGSYARNNTFYHAGHVAIGTEAPKSHYRRLVLDRNIQSAGPTMIFSGNGPNGPPYAGTDWSPWYHADDNVLSSDLKLPVGGFGPTLEDWKKATKSEAHSLTNIVPQFVDPTASPDGYAQSLKLKDEAAFMQHLLTRPPNVWDATYQTESVYEYYRKSFTPTNLPKLDDSKTGFYGASDYRGTPATSQPARAK